MPINVRFHVVTIRLPDGYVVYDEDLRVRFDSRSPQQCRDLMAVDKWDEWRRKYTRLRKEGEMA
ncbi:MAG TPA: hypothetical protein VM531_08995 [Sphingomicrobium sp.]|jgi:hypothetical protein|nr:hypothetical protein [Sphingomicrobium sp.]